MNLIYLLIGLSLLSGPVMINLLSGKNSGLPKG
jgi:hypothetical protein